MDVSYTFSIMQSLCVSADWQTWYQQHYSNISYVIDINIIQQILVLYSWCCWLAGSKPFFQSRGSSCGATVHAVYLFSFPASTYLFFCINDFMQSLYIFLKKFFLYSYVVHGRYLHQSSAKFVLFHHLPYFQSWCWTKEWTWWMKYWRTVGL